MKFTLAKAAYFQPGGERFNRTPFGWTAYPYHLMIVGDQPYTVQIFRITEMNLSKFDVPGVGKVRFGMSTRSEPVGVAFMTQDCTVAIMLACEVMHALQSIDRDDACSVVSALEQLAVKYGWKQQPVEFSTNYGGEDVPTCVVDLALSEMRRRARDRKERALPEG